MLLDEPTTGLDSEAALKLMTLLAKLAAKNRTVRCWCTCSCAQRCSSMRREWQARSQAWVREWKYMLHAHAYLVARQEG